MSWYEFHRKDRDREIKETWRRIELELKEEGLEPYKPIKNNR